MSSCRAQFGDEYTGSSDPTNILGPFSKSLDIAVVDSEEILSPKELDAHTITLDGVIMTWPRFKEIFFQNGIFDINKAKYNSPEILFNKRTINNTRFNLLDSVLRLYASDLGVDRDFLDHCTTTEIIHQLLYYKSLTDMCSISCSLSEKEIVEIIAKRNGFADSGGSALLWHQIFGNGPGEGYHQLVVNARFYNANPAIKDIFVKFYFNVSFGDAYPDISDYGHLY